MQKLEHENYKDDIHFLLNILVQTYSNVIYKADHVNSLICILFLQEF